MSGPQKPDLDSWQAVRVVQAREALKASQAPDWADHQAENVGRLETVTGQLLEVIDELATAPGVTIPPDAFATVLGALEDAQSYREYHAAQPCADCDDAGAEAGFCPDHRFDAQTAQDYGDLAAHLLGGQVSR